MNSYDFAGRAAIVTGAANGIGAAVAEKLRAGGARVASFDRVEATTTDHSVIGDVTDAASVAAGFTAAEDALGPLDVLVCAAGVFGDAVPTAQVSDDLWDRVMSINAGGTLKSIRAVLPAMVARGYGRIVTIASIAGREGLHDGDSYAASKAAVVSLTRTIGRDAAGTGVLVNCVVPALIETAMASQLSPVQHRQAVEKIPLGRLGTPAEVATLVAFLASEDLSFSAGACFDVTGGRANW